MAEVASAYVSLLPSAKGFGRATESQISGEMKSSGTRLGGLLGAGLKVGLLAGAGAAFAGGAFLKGAISQASDLAESTTKIEAIFGKASKSVQSFSDAGARALGQTKLEVLSAASTFGTFGKAAGLSGQDLSKFSTDFVGLSTDLASFNNTTPEQAVEAIGAALRGESEPLRQFGVLLDDATLRQEALKLGLISSTKEALTPQNKVLAAQAAIYKQTKDAQGDFQKTSGGLANQQRILSASFSDIKTKIGTALLPVATKFFTFLNDKGIPAISSAADFLTTGLGPAFANVAAIVSSVFGGEGGGGALSGVLAFSTAIGVQLIPVVQSMANTFTTSVLPALTSLFSYLSANLVPVFVQVAGIIRDQVLPIVASFAQFLYGSLYPALIGIVTAVASKLKPVFDQLIATFRSSVLPTLQLVLAKFREWQPTIQKVIVVVAKIIGKVLEFAAVILGKVLPPVIRFAGFLLSNLVPAVIRNIEIIAQIIGKVIEFGKAIVDRVKDVAKFVTGLKEKFTEAVNFVKTIPGRLIAALGDIARLFYEKGAAIVRALADGIKSLASLPVDVLKEIGGGLADLIPGSPVKKGPLRVLNNGYAGRKIIEMLADGMKAGSPAAAKAAEESAQKIADKFRDKLEGIRDSTASLVDSLKGQFASLRDSIADSFSGDLFNVSAPDVAAGLLQLPDDFASLSADEQKRQQAIVDQVNAFHAKSGGGIAGAFIDNLLGTKANLKELGAAFKKLVRFGLDPSFLSQLFASGNGGLILDLAGGPRGQARQAQSLFGQIDQLSNRLGTAVAKNDPNYGELVKHTSELQQIKRELKSLPKNLSRALDGAAASGSRSR